jgi:hypothetical protein
MSESAFGRRLACGEDTRDRIESTASRGVEVWKRRERVRSVQVQGTAGRM